ncbi:MAG: shikimate kinase [Acidimicrobiales bacterium]
MVDRIVLVGMMGAGKTTVGRLLADRLGWAYLDSDAEVAATTGRTLPELFAERGEAAFRAEEARVLAEALSGDEPVVVSAAGGVVLSKENCDLLATSGTVVWLRAEPSLLARRVGTGEGRPLLDGGPAAALVELDRVRRPLYATVAAVTVDVDDLTPLQVVDRVLGDRVLADAGIGQEDRS